MLSLRLTRRAQSDLLDIAVFTRKSWGDAQAILYLGDLSQALTLLANSSNLGRTCEHIRAGLRRHEHQRHVIFYRIQVEAIVFSRILHRSMLPEASGFPN